MALLHPRDSERRARLANALRSHVPPVPPGSGPPVAPRAVEVFTVGTDRVQVTWRALGPGAVTVRVGPRVVTTETDGGPGALTVGGLEPDATHTVEVTGPGLGDHGTVTRTTRTLPRPGGELLHRIATVSDVHLGSRATGYLHTMVEKPAPEEPHPLRCLRAALSEASSWGADELLIKGDLVDTSNEEAWRHAEHALGDLGLPVHLLPGNHELSPRGDVDPAVRLADLGHELIRGVAVHDRPGVRLVLVETARQGTDRGHVSAVTDDVVEAVGDTDGPALVVLHHQLMRWRVPTYLPVGIPGPEARAFLSRVGRANPHTLVTSGHTHRHRRRRHGPVTISEVGSTKDYPGTWAGYEVYEGGLVQIVHRIERPDCIRWTDHTRRAAAGVWQLWSPGRIDDRCFTLRW